MNDCANGLGLASKTLYEIRQFSHRAGLDVVNAAAARGEILIFKRADAPPAKLR
jgi:hypothetical protein